MLPGPPFIGNAFLRSASITDPDFKESTVQHFDLDFQYQHKSYVFSLAYAGAKGTHLALGQDNNQPLLASPWPWDKTTINPSLPVPLTL